MNLFKKLFIVLALPVVFASCLKSKDSGCGLSLSTAKASDAEVASLQTYLDTNGIVATKHPNGFFYKIGTQGSGTVAGACSGVTVKYTGKLTNGTTFDSSNPNYPNGITFTLGQLIAGWQIGIPLIQPGGTITLYLPPSLAYGSSGAGSAVPPNSTLVFDITLVAVQ